jgi:hypothetical protein
VHEDVIVYLVPGGKDYVARFENDGWLRWPAEAHGWHRRAACPEQLAEACWELEPKLADLALRLSGVMR